jgi:NADPH2 dehydrogenase
MEGTYIYPQAGGYANVPGIYNKARIKAWKEFTAAVHAKAGFIYCQLCTLSPTAKPEILEAEGFNVVSKSAVPASEGSPVHRALTEEGILQYLRDYAHTAKNAIATGFDGVDIHGANGYRSDQFLPPSCNKRRLLGRKYRKSCSIRYRNCQKVAEAVEADRTDIRLSPFNLTLGIKIADPVPQFGCLVYVLKELKLPYIHFIGFRNARNENEENVDSLVSIWGKTSPVLIAGYVAKDVNEIPTPSSRKPSLSKASFMLGKYRNTDVVVVYGWYFIANPDLVLGFEKGLKLNEHDRTTFYKAKATHDHTYLPFSDEFKATIKVGDA